MPAAFSARAGHGGAGTSEPCPLPAWCSGAALGRGGSGDGTTGPLAALGTHHVALSFIHLCAYLHTRAHIRTHTSYIYIHAHVYTRAHVHVHAHTYTRVHYTHPRAHTCTYTHTYTHTHTRTHMYTHTHAYTHTVKSLVRVLDFRIAFDPVAFLPETQQHLGVWLRRASPSRGPEGQGPPAHRSQCLSCWSQVRRLSSWQPLPPHGGHRSPTTWRTGTPLSHLHGAPRWPNDRSSPKCAPRTDLS